MRTPTPTRYPRATGAHARPTPPTPRRALGLGLMELLVTMAVVAIVVRMTLPFYNGFIGRANIDAMSNELESDIALARLEAVRRQAPIYLCSTPSPNPGAVTPSCSAATANWAQGRWIYCYDVNQTGACCPEGQGACATPYPSYRILKVRQAQTSGIGTLTGPSAALIFHANGSVTGASVPLTFTACWSGQTGRQITLGIGGNLLAQSLSGTC